VTEQHPGEDRDKQNSYGGQRIGDVEGTCLRLGSGPMGWVSDGQQPPSGSAPRIGSSGSGTTGRPHSADRPVRLRLGHKIDALSCDHSGRHEVAELDGRNALDRSCTDPSTSGPWWAARPIVSVPGLDQNLDPLPDPPLGSVGDQLFGEIAQPGAPGLDLARRELAVELGCSVPSSSE
jgi:hypothetical protein